MIMSVVSFLLHWLQRNQSRRDCWNVLLFLNFRRSCFSLGSDLRPPRLQQPPQQQGPRQQQQGRQQLGCRVGFREDRWSLEGNHSVLDYLPGPVHSDNLRWVGLCGSVLNSSQCGDSIICNLKLKFSSLSVGTQSSA